MKALVRTETGSYYEVTDCTLTRVYMGERSLPLRKDGESLLVVEWITRPEVGKPMEALLTNVATNPDVMTLRFTSPVTAIDWKEEVT